MTLTSVLRRAAAVTLPAALAVVTLSAPPAAAKSDFTVKPFMGWSSWSVQASTHPDYGKSWLNETNVRNAADAMASKLKSAGYKYINMDAGWNATLDWTFHSDANGIPSPDPTRFPSGLKSTVDYIHDKGLKAGLYGVAGLEKEVYDKNAPIAGAPGCTTRSIAQQPLTPTNMWDGNWKIDYSDPCSQKFIDSIADKLASWEVDFIKIDGTTADNVEDIAAWGKAIDQSGRKMWLTASAWPVPREIGDDLRPYANSVRIDTDVECYCDTITSWTGPVDDRWNNLPNWLNKVRPNYWPDLDAMPISNNTGSGIQDGLNDIERQSVMTFWSMASSPLYVGGDIYFMDEKAQSILTNPEVIAVNQSGVLPTRITGGNQQSWKKKLPDGSWAVAVYNLGGSATDIKVDLSSLGLRGIVKVRDLAARTDLGNASGSWTAENVPSHGSRIIKLSGGSQGTITGIGDACVDANGTNPQNGARVTLYTCNGETNQRWTRQGDTFRTNGKCLTATGTANNSAVRLNNCTNTAGQKWTEPGDGTLRNQASGRCLDAVGGSSADNTPLIVYDCHGNANQRWKHTPA
ncbi:ricin-type beta-trefoil lectin domain protein [Streptomyces sp. NPDC056501]|uniref:ricin-type beta-trefoil lectin domain protein n=1 Tax=Streptomyces sp. NPDC056501 TaxID=3345841 RepID=UPI003680ADC0